MDRIPVQDWKEMMVLQWIDKLQIQDHVKVILKQIVFFNHITGSDLQEAKTSHLMIQLFNSAITKAIADYLCQSVNIITLEYKQRLAINQQRFIQMNTPKITTKLPPKTHALPTNNSMRSNKPNKPHSNTLPPNKTDEWDSKPIKEWNIEDTINWIFSLNLSPPKAQVIADGFRKAKWNGNYLLSVGSGYDLANDHIAHGADITVTLAELIFDHLKKLKECRAQKKKVQHTKKVIATPSYIPTVDRIVSDPFPYASKLYGWKGKNIDVWSCEELQQWIMSLNINNTMDELQIIEAIEANQCTGYHFKQCHDGKEIERLFPNYSFTEHVCDHIWKQMQLIPMQRYHTDDDIKSYVPKATLITPTHLSTGMHMIGLHNLGNTCFNAVIQCLLHTQPLTQLFTTMKANHNHKSTLDVFIEIAQIAMSHTVINNVINSKSIVNYVRNNDNTFSKREQENALVIMLKILDLLDADIIHRQRINMNVKSIQNDCRSWQLEGDKEDIYEEAVIIRHLADYNPYKSIIRETIHFVERNTLFCMNAGCNYKESRYDIKQNVLLQVEDHSMDIMVDIYIAATKQCIKSQMFRVLDYCSVDTLRHQIFHRLSCILHKKHKVRLESIEQIQIKMINANESEYFKNWIVDIDPHKECRIFREANVFVIASIASELNHIYDQNQDFVSVVTMEILVHENGCNMVKIEMDEIQNGGFKSFANVATNPKHAQYERYLYFDDVAIDRVQSEHLQIDKNKNVIICVWIAKNMMNKDASFVHFDRNHFENVDNEIWKCLLYEKCGGNFRNYRKCKTILMNLRDKTLKTYQNSGKASNSFSVKWIQSLEKSISYFDALERNQQRVYKWTHDAFKQNNRIQNQQLIVKDVESAFNVYNSDKLLDRGIVLKCRKCQRKSAVVKLQTQIIRYPQILIVALDRYMHMNTKYDRVIKYGHELKLEHVTYQLYAVCNHSGSLNSGHYWSYIKNMEGGWHTLNDVIVRRIKAQYAVNDQNAIVLMYQQIRQTQL